MHYLCYAHSSYCTCIGTSMWTHDQSWFTFTWRHVALFHCLKLAQQWEQLYQINACNCHPAAHACKGGQQDHLFASFESVMTGMRTNYAGKMVLSCTVFTPAQSPYRWPVVVPNAGTTRLNRPTNSTGHQVGVCWRRIALLSKRLPHRLLHQEYASISVAQPILLL